MVKPKALINEAVQEVSSCVGVFARPAACPGRVLFGQQGAAWVVGDPWLTLGC